MTKLTLDSALNYLKKTKIFESANKKLLISVLKEYGKAISYSKNDIVFSKETYSPVICIIIKGEARFLVRRFYIIKIMILKTQLLHSLP